jgi:Cys-tRNA(Pro) deacylase
MITGNNFESNSASIHPDMNSEDVQKFLVENSITARLHRFPSPVRTALEAQAAIGNSEIALAKTLVVDVADQTVLIVLPVAKRVSEKALASLFSVPRSKVSMCRADRIVELTGFPPGGIPPIGHLVQMRTILDEALVSHDRLFLGGGDEYSLLEITPNELIRAARAQTSRFD